jgi:arginyl-tRNA synthetase
VTTDNHIGDWGTQFGMVIYGWKNLIDPVAIEADPLQELLRLYRAVNLLCKEDESIKDECRDELLKLQSGDAENFGIWEKCVDVSKVGLNKIYDRLDVSFDHWLGESYYNNELAPLVRNCLGVNAPAFPLARMLHGGTWSAGRRLAKEKRRNGAPPLTLKLTGTVF